MYPEGYGKDTVPGHHSVGPPTFPTFRTTLSRCMPGTSRLTASLIPMGTWRATPTAWETEFCFRWILYSPTNVPRPCNNWGWQASYVLLEPFSVKNLTPPISSTSPNPKSTEPDHKTTCTVCFIVVDFYWTRTRNFHKTVKGSSLEVTSAWSSFAEMPGNVSGSTNTTAPVFTFAKAGVLVLDTWTNQDLVESISRHPKK